MNKLQQGNNVTAKHSMAVYSKRVALELRERGFKLTHTGVNTKFPQFDVYYFDNAPGFKEAFAMISGIEYKE